MPDSSVIADYLENKYPTPPLYPAAPFARARALWFEEYVDGGVFPVMGPGLFFERVVKKFQRGVTDHGALRANRRREPAAFLRLSGKRNSRQGILRG